MTDDEQRALEIKTRNELSVAARHVNRLRRELALARLDADACEEPRAKRAAIGHATVIAEDLALARERQDQARKAGERVFQGRAGIMPAGAAKTRRATAHTPQGPKAPRTAAPTPSLDDWS